MIDVNDLNFLCKYKSGSYLYGTNTDNSDIDWCGVYIDDIYNIQNYKVLINADNKIDSIDYKFCELKTYAEDVINGDFFKLEPLIIDKNKLTISSDQWEQLRLYYNHFLNSEDIFKWVINYCYKELFWANSPVNIRNELRHNKIIDRFNNFGFDNAAFGHCILTAVRARLFFEDNIFYSNISKKDVKLCNLILNIKQNPQQFTSSELNDISEECVNKLRLSFKNRIANYKPNLNILNKLIQSFYH